MLNYRLFRNNHNISRRAYLEILELLVNYHRECEFNVGDIIPLILKDGSKVGIVFKGYDHTPLTISFVDFEITKCDDLSEYGNVNITNKPPIGIKPRKLFEDDINNAFKQRSLELLEAMKRYVEEDKRVPTEWVDEFSEFNC